MIMKALLVLIAEIGSKGWIVTISGFLITIIALIVLFLIFSLVAKIVNADYGKFLKKRTTNDDRKPTIKGVDTVNDDIKVVIGLALALSSEVHDTEADEITITRIERRYSPWSSKIYGLNNLNR